MVSLAEEHSDEAGYGIVGYVRREEKGEHRGMIGDAM